jgi:hypothetical protein
MKERIIISMGVIVILGLFTCCEGETYLIGDPQSDETGLVSEDTTFVSSCPPNQKVCGEEPVTICLRSSSWEDYPSGCPSWWLGLEITPYASLHCEEISTTDESVGWTAGDITVREGRQVIDANSSCCLSPDDQVSAVFVCECSGTAYIHYHRSELLDGVYDAQKIVFYYRETHSCNR